MAGERSAEQSLVQKHRVRDAEFGQRLETLQAALRIGLVETVDQVGRTIRRTLRQQLAGCGHQRAESAIRGAAAGLQRFGRQEANRPIERSRRVLRDRDVRLPSRDHS